MTTIPSVISEDKALSILNKATNTFVMLWKGGETTSTESIAELYDVMISEIITTLDRHYLEFDGEMDGEDGWTPRAALRMGMLLNCPLGRQVRSLALDIIEALNSSQKREGIRKLFQRSDFVSWSDRELARLMNCDNKTVAKVRKELESSGVIEKTTERISQRNGEAYTYTTRATDTACEEIPHMLYKSTQTDDENWITISGDHPHHSGQRVALGHKPNHDQTFVRFEDGTQELLYDRYLKPESDAQPQPPRNRLYTQEEINDIQEQHRREIERLEADIRIGIKTEERTTPQLEEELAASREVARALRAQNIKLTQQVEELQGLRKLEEDNQQLRTRIQELENATKYTPVSKWEPELHLRALADRTCEFQPQSFRQVTRLLSMALASVVVNSHDSFHKSLLKPAGEILGVEGNKKAIALKLEDLRELPEALKEFKAAVARAQNWEELKPIAEKYQHLKPEIWGELEQEERNKIKTLKDDDGIRSTPDVLASTDIVTQKEAEPPLTVGTHVTHADPYHTESRYHGIVLEVHSSDEVDVQWEEMKGQIKDTHRYDVAELKVLKSELQVA